MNDTPIYYQDWGTFAAGVLAYDRLQDLEASEGVEELYDAWRGMANGGILPSEVRVLAQPRDPSRLGRDWSAMVRGLRRVTGRQPDGSYDRDLVRVFLGARVGVDLYQWSDVVGGMDETCWDGALSRLLAHGVLTEEEVAEWKQGVPA